MSFKYRSAVGLSYDQDKDAAPWLSVKGEHELAGRIVRYAKRFNIPIVEDNKLAASLSETDLDSLIPNAFFEPVAIVLKSLEKHLGVSKPKKL